MFQPNLIPNSKVENPIDLKSIIGDSVSDYIISYKKDGCRLELQDGKVLTRALKPVQSDLVVDRFKRLAKACAENGVVLEGEFYSHGMNFREIARFFKTSDVTDPKHIKKLEADKSKFNITGTKKEPIWIKPVHKIQEDQWRSEGYISKFEEDWSERTVEWLSTFHDDLKIWPFDLFLPNYPEMTYEARMVWFFSHVVSTSGIFYEFRDLIELGTWYNLPKGSKCGAWLGVEKLYELALIEGWEGLVLANKTRTYKFGRSTAKAQEIYKMKEDKLKFDGEVLDIIEGTVAREGAPKSTNELGRSVTSKLKEDRIPSGIASGISSTYEGHPIKVSFQGYSHDELREILENKNKYIGRWFHYTGMAPTKNVPRHAFMHRNGWRDEK